ncbi:MAG: inorganic phosphate transporter [Nitrospirae bacterium]|nr:inorganic phosphate transporter [Nitrospirota bacterium]
MSGFEWIVPILMVILAYVNGANDVSKGIATLVGSGVTDYQKALAWGTVWTVAGALLGSVLAVGMLKTISTGIVSIHQPFGILFPISVLFGALAWVGFASRFGLPVSTTHSIVGALVGSGLTMYGSQAIVWTSLYKKIVIPLLFSPLISFGLIFLLFPVLRSAFGKWKGHCFCLIPIQPSYLLVNQKGGISKFSVSQGESLPVLSPVEDCSGQVQALKLNIDTFHWLTSGLTSFSRGLNDTPKIVALGMFLFLTASHPTVNHSFYYFLASALGMGLGSYWAGRKVTQVLAEKVTRMDHLEGFSANAVTSFLVGTSANFGLPVSTTHVASGAIIGMGLKNGKGIDWKTVWEMVLAWGLTLPVSGFIAGLTVWILSRFIS